MSEIKKQILKANLTVKERRLNGVWELSDAEKQEIGSRIDRERDIIIEGLNEVWRTLKLEPLPLPTSVK